MWISWFSWISIISRTEDDGTTGQHGHRRAVIRAAGGRPVVLPNDDGTDDGHNWAGITATGGHPGVCPVMLTTEWTTTGQKMAQHALTSWPFTGWNMVSVHAKKQFCYHKSL